MPMKIMTTLVSKTSIKNSRINHILLCFFCISIVLLIFLCKSVETSLSIFLVEPNHVEIEGKRIEIKKIHKVAIQKQNEGYKNIIIHCSNEYQFENSDLYGVYDQCSMVGFFEYKISYFGELIPVNFGPLLDQYIINASSKKIIHVVIEDSGLWLNNVKIQEMQLVDFFTNTNSFHDTILDIYFSKRSSCSFLITIISLYYSRDGRDIYLAKFSSV